MKPGDEKLYRKGTDYDAAREHFAERHGFDLGRVYVREDGGGIYCGEATDDRQANATQDSGDHTAGDSGGGAPESDSATAIGAGEVTG